MFNPAGTSKDLRKLVSNKIKPSQNDLAIALCIGRQGEISDLTAEGQHYRIAGLNLLTAITIYWNTRHLGHAAAERRNEGFDVPPGLLAHISP